MKTQKKTIELLESIPAIELDGAYRREIIADGITYAEALDLIADIRCDFQALAIQFCLGDWGGDGFASGSRPCFGGEPTPAQKKAIKAVWRAIREGAKI